MFGGDFDIDFIAGTFVVDVAFVVQIEAMAIGGCGFGIIEDGLV